MNPKDIKIGFFGGPEISVLAAEKLFTAGYVFSCVVTTPDKPQGRKMEITPSPLKKWATEKGIPVLQPEKLSEPSFIESLTTFSCDVFIVMAYGKIIPDSVLYMPKGKTLNIHPSLLPRFRGPAPIESAILADEKNTGVTIMRLDSEVDHGPIVAQKEIIVEPWPPTAQELGQELVEAGADMLAELLPDWMRNLMPEIEQDHSLATFTEKTKKEDGEIDLSGDPYKNFLKIQAYHGWPSAYFFYEKEGKKMRVKITKARFENGTLILEKIIPEGKPEMDYSVDCSPKFAPTKETA